MLAATEQGYPAIFIPPTRVRMLVTDCRPEAHLAVYGDHSTEMIVRDYLVKEVLIDLLSQTLKL